MMKRVISRADSDKHGLGETRLLRPVFFQTKKGNSYFYSRKANQVLLCHPLLRKIAEQGSVRPGATGGPDNETQPSDEFPPAVVAYYRRKYLHLQSHGYFDPIDPGEVLTGRLRADDIRRLIANTAHVTFETTEACNLRCAYCAYGKFYNRFNRRADKNMSPDMAKALLAYFAKLWSSNLNASHNSRIVIGFYGGEPLLNFPFIREMVAHAQGLRVPHKRFVFTMTTNGLLLPRHMDFLAEHKFLLMISMDGDEAQNSYRVTKDGRSSFSTLFKNVRALRAAHPRYFARYVSFATVVHNRNSVGGAWKFFRQHFGKSPIFSALNKNGIVPERGREFMETYQNLQESFAKAEPYQAIVKEGFLLEPKYRELAESIHNFSGNVFETYMRLLFPRTGRFIPTATCLPFSSKVFLAANGNILPCERIGQRYPLGHVEGAKVHLDPEAVAAQYNELFDLLRPRCQQGCAQALSCASCLFNFPSRAGRLACDKACDAKVFSERVAEDMSTLEDNRKCYQKIMQDMAFR